MRFSKRRSPSRTEERSQSIVGQCNSRVNQPDILGLPVRPSTPLLEECAQKLAVTQLKQLCLKS
ncbi:hypothetical protein K4039_14880 [Lyngbya sp. CCAP 1446/10]|uniref:hypothetical protein n=1 Tax=Lyngbya sp. CCAP 1446/10 TaxID=439293 RepID=UPI0022370EBC|nr:hypothetical protein [Lyngbya sp. CCAP 1446/10]MCW6051338.1 hypothetical protein [Lyngbya sp. CCAP 1446/10]